MQDYHIGVEPRRFRRLRSNLVPKNQPQPKFFRPRFQSAGVVGSQCSFCPGSGSIAFQERPSPDVLTSVWRFLIWWYATLGRDSGARRIRAHRRSFYAAEIPATGHLISSYHDQTFSHAACDRLTPRCRTKLPQNRTDVKLHGMLGDFQSSGDVLVPPPLC